MAPNHRGDLRGTGEGLTENAIQWGRRPDIRPTFSLTPRDLNLFAWLEQHRFATTGILSLLFWRSYSAAARQRLKLLHDTGFLDKFRPALPPGAGTAEWIYRLTHRGWRVLDDRGRTTAATLRLGEVTDLAYVSHDLQLDATLLHAADLAYRGAAPLIERLPFAWQGPELGRVERGGGEPAIRRSAWATLPEGHTVRPGAQPPGSSGARRHPDRRALLKHDRPSGTDRRAPRIRPHTAREQAA